MALIDRVKNILLSPKTEWPVIAGETASLQSLYVGYVLILAAIAPVVLILGTGGKSIGIALVSYGIALVVTYLLALIADILAPTFGGEKNFIASLKLTAYSYTAAWLAGVFHVLPVLGAILTLAAAIYSIYTFYLGVPVLKKCPPQKALAYTIVVVICGVVLGVALTNVLMSALFGVSLSGAMGAPPS